MTPKEKAEELLHKMQLDWGCNCCYNDWAKQCALVAVEELIEHDDIDDYWIKVKQEIKNL
jgi:hypothetical protein